MTSSRIIEKALRASTVFIAAALATALLFTVMLALIATSFEHRVEDTTTTEFVVIDTDLNVPVIKAKISDANTSLLNPIDLPPATESKITPRQNKPQLSPIISFIEGAVMPGRLKPDISVNMPRIYLSGGADTALSLSGTSGQKQCTLIAHIGPGARDVAGIEVMNCLNGELADAAETELYKWVHGGADSYLTLGAQPGDAVEFTYEETRRQ